MRWRTIRWLALAFLASCGVEATKPLTSPSSAKADPALPGTWVATDKDDLVFVVTAKEGGVVHVDVTGRDEPLTFEGHVSVLAKDLKVLNLRAIEDGKPKGNWLFVRYAVNASGAMELWLVNDGLASEALNAGTLKGHRGQYGGVTLEETPEKMIAFLTKGPREATFEPLITLARAKR